MESPRDIFLRMYPILMWFGSSHSWALGGARHWSKGSSLFYSALLRGTQETGSLGMASGWSSYEINTFLLQTWIISNCISVLWCQEFPFSPCFQRPIFIILVGIKQGPKQLLAHHLTLTNEGKEENSIRPHLLSEKVYFTESRETAGYKAKFFGL